MEFTSDFSPMSFKIQCDGDIERLWVHLYDCLQIGVHLTFDHSRPVKIGVS